MFLHHNCALFIAGKGKKLALLRSHDNEYTSFFLHTATDELTLVSIPSSAKDPYA